MLEKLNNFHKTRNGYIFFAVVELALFYIFLSIALDTANMFTYATALILLIGVVVNLVNATIVVRATPVPVKVTKPHKVTTKKAVRKPKK